MANVWEWASRAGTLAKLWPLLAKYGGPVLLAALAGISAARESYGPTAIGLFSLVTLAAALHAVAFIQRIHIQSSHASHMTAAQAAARVELRRSRIQAWRAMVSEVHAQHRAQEVRDFKGERYNVEDLLEAHEAFHSLRPHLQADTVAIIWAEGRGPYPEADKLRADRRAYNTPIELVAVLCEIERLEREWDLA